ncbi:TPA: tyrosine-type recombinase/integrase [Legionella pneumophila]|uniref:tyrosine-type recombinase/integrase n=1 Tax=Legionella pneumophila TaxID=446 RepID=UPI0002FC2341|nr:site-specific integrase [Legionella pneumophila]MCZ4680350.1 site-specific integrase [Legionella pneumophila]MDW8854104.1 site-specific integrase [Legionella pneumophila]MDW8921350.1 site-specific integrase [Legionella pneumophila]MDW8927684.1 site-specific integrase [Legionella pneumophila]MDW8982404.1 site-specific integrase [Legionella pneumophila]
MGRKRTPGLQKRGSVWCIDKKVFGRRLCESTGTDNLEEAEKYLARRLEEIRLATVYGVRPKRTFKEAATKFLMENQHKRSISDDAGRLREVVKYIGDLPIEAIHIGSLQSFIEGRRKDEVSTRTINHGLMIVRRILNLAASEWMDEFGLTWLNSAPRIKLLPEPDLRKPYPLSWDEQHKLFQQLPEHLKNMALFAVNTGCRDREICELRWDWEIQIPELPHIIVFIVPGELVKNGEERLIVCNETVREVIEGERGKHPTHVFSFKGRPLSRMLSTGWRQAREKAKLPEVRVHDLKHTFGRRLRAAGVSFEDRQDLLGHRSGRITTHYSSAELQSLYQAANKICENRKSGVILTLLRTPKSRPASQNTLRESHVSL